MTTIDKRTGMLSAVWTFGEDRKYPPLPSKMIIKFCIKIKKNSTFDYIQSLN